MKRVAMDNAAAPYHIWHGLFVPAPYVNKNRRQNLVCCIEFSCNKNKKGCTGRSYRHIWSGSGSQLGPFHQEDATPQRMPSGLILKFAIVHWKQRAPSPTTTGYLSIRLWIMTSTSDNDRSVQNACATLLDALKIDSAGLFLDKSLQDALMAEITSWNLGLENDPKHAIMIQFAAALPAVGLCHKFSAAIACWSSSSQLVFPNHTPKLKQLIGALIWWILLCSTLIQLTSNTQVGAYIWV